MQFSRREFLQLSSAAALYPLCAGASALTDPATAELCRKLKSDPLRPQYHLLPAHNWMNDPNGPIFFKGQYHMFHQYNPLGATWGNMNWAHATSPDLIHWQHEGIALSPTPGGYDRDGVFSGSAVLDQGRPTVIYTGVMPPSSEYGATLKDGVHVWREVQCLAVAEDDDLRTWKKLPEPVIAAPPAGFQVTGFRDPYVWRGGGQWMLILGSGFQGKGGAILLYTSADLRHWSYLHPLVGGTRSGEKGTNPVDTGDMWECPDFFPLGDKYVLLISTMGKVRWKVGTYSNQKFIPEKEGIVDWGSYYAAKTMVDKDGSRILWGWIPETRSDAQLIAAGWAGAMSLPRILSLDSRGELVSEVHAAAQMLRDTPVSIARGQNGKHLDDVRIRNLSAELAVEFQPKGAECALRLQSEDGTDFANVSILEQNGTRRILVNDVSAPLSSSPESPVRLHMYLDGSVLELFVDGGTTLTARIYKIPNSPLRLKFDRGELLSLKLWPMKPISPDRLTGSLCSR